MYVLSWELNPCLVSCSTS